MSKAYLLTAALTLLAAAGCRSPREQSPRPVAPADREQSEAPSPPLGFGSLSEHAIYFVMLDRYFDGRSDNNHKVRKGEKGAFHGGDLAGLTAKLDYIASLGVSALWLTPVSAQVEAPVFGAGFRDTAYHGYWPKDLSGVDESFGTEAELMTLVREAHARDMRVILDVVVNHVGYKSPLAQDATLLRSTETGTCPPDDEASDLSRCLFGLPDFRTEDSSVRARIVEATVRWARFGVDGMRIDAMRHVEPILLEEIRTALQAHWDKHFPQVDDTPLLLGEWWGAAPDDDASRILIAKGPVDGLIDFSVHGNLEGFLNGRMRAEAFAHHLEQRARSGAAPFAYFLDSHDVPTFLSRLDEEGAAHRYALAPYLFFIQPGAPIVTWGNEVARRGGKWPLNRTDMPWSSLDEAGRAQAREVFSTLIRLRREHPLLRGEHLEIAHASTDAEGATVVIALGPETAQERGLVAVRRGPGPAEVKIPAPERAGEVWCLRSATTAGGAQDPVLRIEGAGALVLSLPGESGAVWLTQRRGEGAGCNVGGRRTEEASE